MDIKIADVFVLVSESDEVCQTISAHVLISDALRAREVYIDEQYNGQRTTPYTIGNRYGDEPATTLDISIDDEIVETLSIQATQLS